MAFQIDLRAGRATVWVENEAVSVTIRRSQRARRIRFRVVMGRIEMVVPMRAREAAMGQAIEMCADWFARVHPKLKSLQESIEPLDDQAEVRKRANSELKVRLLQWAKKIGEQPARVSIRAQSTRWGSCSSRRTISLNWRLILAPEFVQDYICLHELAHLRHMNHSPEFWAQVQSWCPEYKTAEAWLKSEGHRLMMRS